jgi:hypothetical protein
MAPAPMTVIRFPAAGLEPGAVGAGHRLHAAMLLRGVETDSTIVLIDRAASMASKSETQKYSELASRVEDDRVVGCFVVGQRQLRPAAHSLAHLGALVGDAKRYVALMPRRRSDLPHKRKPGRPIDSLMIDPQSFSEVLRSGKVAPKYWPYFAAIRAIESLDPDQVILAPQLPLVARPMLPVPNTPVRVVIPHRGDLAHLRNCLHRVAKAGEGLDLRVSVALDEDERPEHEALVRSFPAVQFFRVTPSGGGPYVPRHLLGMAAQEPMVVFQDSDDVPTRDRFRILLATAAARNSDVVGSHVLDVHEDVLRVKAMRYPLDAIAPLIRKPQNTVFHPATLVRTEALRAAEGFSTVRRMACDREFNLRAFFLSLDLRNVDDFLYVRRMRSDSLIHSADTGMKSAARKQLHEMWHEDFRRILAAEIDVRGSSIWPRHLDPLPQLVSLTSVERGVAANS